MDARWAFWRNGISCATLIILVVAAIGRISNARAARSEDLIAAAERGDARRVAQLLRWGAKPDARRADDNDTALLVAARAGHLQVVRRLVDAGADVNQSHAAMGSPLQTAIINKRADVVAFLLTRGATPNAHTRFGDPLLGLAAAREAPDVLRLLLQAGADPNALSRDGWTPLMYAWGDDAEAARVLIAYGASLRPVSRRAGKGWGEGRAMREHLLQ